MGRFFDRINFVKHRRDAQEQARNREQEALETFDRALRDKVNATLKEPDPVARYIALASLPAEFEKTLSAIYAEKFQDALKKSNKAALDFVKLGGVMGAGLAVGFGVFIAPGAALVGVAFGALFMSAPALAADSNRYNEMNEASEATKPYRDRVAHYGTVIRDISSRLADENLERFAASKEWDRLVALNPGLHAKLSEAFRATALKRAEEPPPAPLPPPQKGFSL